MGRLTTFALTGLVFIPVRAYASPLLDAYEWLLLPLSGSAEHHIAAAIYWHARLMVLSWGILLPLGALAARFFKVLPGQQWPQHLDNKAWWHAHRLLQYAGVVAMTAGLALVWGGSARPGPVAALHVAIGWGLCFSAWLQLASGLLRGTKGGPADAALRGDHYDMTRWRVSFERLHKSLGWLCVAMTVPAILLGLWLADAPRWMALVLGVWWIGLMAAFGVLQRKGRCMDTCQAIWGPGLEHPGNRRRPIGWGVRRAGVDHSET